MARNEVGPGAGGEPTTGPRTSQGVAGGARQARVGGESSGWWRGEPLLRLSRPSGVAPAGRAARRNTRSSCSCDYKF